MSIEPRERRRYILSPFDEFDEIFETMWNMLNGSLEPLAELEEEDKTVKVTVDLPFVQKHDIKIKVTDTSLDIEAKLNRCITFEKWGTTQKRCEFRLFRKVLALPTRVTATGAKATFNKGILILELPKIAAEHDIKVE
jgi:HSP20 family protein